MKRILTLIGDEINWDKSSTNFTPEQQTIFVETNNLEDKRDLTIRELQTKLPWTIRYSQDFRSSPMTHKDFAHALHHVSKAAGKLHALADDMDHDRMLADSPELKENAKYIADLVVCALRIANVFPGGVIDLQTAVMERIETKNQVKL